MSNGMGHFDGFSVQFLICWFCFSYLLGEHVPDCVRVCGEHDVNCGGIFIFNLPCSHSLVLSPSHLRAHVHSHPFSFTRWSFSRRSTCYTISVIPLPLYHRRICVAHTFCIIFIYCDLHLPTSSLLLLTQPISMPYHKQYNRSVRALSICRDTEKQYVRARKICT